MTLEDINKLYEHYSKLLADSQKEIERLRAEIGESKTEIALAKAEERKAAAAANEKAYMKARYRRDMHEERIAAHEAKIIDLEYGHLIDVEEYKNQLVDLVNWENSTRNKAAADFVQCVGELERIASDFEAAMQPYNKLRAFLQKKIYRKYDPNNPNEIDSYMPDVSPFVFRSVARMIGAANQPHSIQYMDIKRWAANFLKYEAAKAAGLEDKAKEVLESD